jgi:hypothetical protein
VLPQCLAARNTLHAPLLPLIWAAVAPQSQATRETFRHCHRPVCILLMITGNGCLWMPRRSSAHSPPRQASHSPTPGVHVYGPSGTAAIPKLTSPSSTVPLQWWPMCHPENVSLHHPWAPLGCWPPQKQSCCHIIQQRSTAAATVSQYSWKKSESEMSLILKT